MQRGEKKNFHYFVSATYMSFTLQGNYKCLLFLCLKSTQIQQTMWLWNLLHIFYHNYKPKEESYSGFGCSHSISNHHLR